MNLAKISIATASLIALGTLTACQSTNSPKENVSTQKMHGKYDHEQRKHMKKMHTEQREGMKKIKAACDGKAAGTATQVQIGDKTIEGTCNLVFKADRKDFKDARAESKPMRGEHKPMQGEMRGKMGAMPSEPLTDAQRAELTKKFDQRLAQHQANQNAMAQACQGQKAGTTIQLKMGEQTINGKCEVRFQPNKPLMPAPMQPKAA